MKRFALVTSRDVGDLDEDMKPLLSALREAGACAEPVVWDDPAVDWPGYDLAVLRSTWDYVTRCDEFLAWADRVTRLANPAPSLRWNTDKHYLLDFQGAGLPAVPTHFIEPADPVRFPFPGAIVVKPAVGAGSMDAERYAGADGAAEAHVRRLQAAGRSVLVQPYLDRIDQAGETALVYLAGEYSHAIRKGPMLRPDREVAGGLFVKEDIRPREPSPAERDLAERAVRAAPKPLLYGRVDVAPGPDGGPMILEFECVEPSLFFPFAPGSAARFARALLNQARRNGTS